MLVTVGIFFKQLINSLHDLIIIINSLCTGGIYAHNNNLSYALVQLTLHIVCPYGADISNVELVAVYIRKVSSLTALYVYNTNKLKLRSASLTL